jgi:hypothetical protein
VVLGAASPSAVARVGHGAKQDLWCPLRGSACG